MKLTDTIDFELAKVLDNKIASTLTGKRYAVTECTVTCGDGTEIFKPQEIIPEYAEYIYGDTLFAPTYAEVIDWLFDKGIVIEFQPFFTFALAEHVAYCYKVYDFNVENSLMFQSVDEMSSFRLAMRDIIKKLIELGKI